MRDKIEVALWNEYGEPTVERVEGGRTTIHLGLNTLFQGQSTLLAHLLDTQELLAFNQLWADNAADREFVQTPEYLLIRAGSNPKP